jgi:hypothetical protein
MIRRIIVILISVMIVASCGAAAPTEAPAATESSTQALLPERTPTPETTRTFTPEPTFTPSVIPTETSLPPLELPTEMLNAPAQLAWDGAPTYLGDSEPGFSFRVLYNPETWALTEDQFGFPALGHRNIPYCVISVTSGRGMPGNVTVEHDVLYLPNLTFDVTTAFESGVRKFVTYTGGDRRIITGFQVSFEEQADQCLEDALTVLATLRSVPVSQATPQPTP